MYCVSCLRPVSPKEAGCGFTCPRCGGKLMPLSPNSDEPRRKDSEVSPITKAIAASRKAPPGYMPVPPHPRISFLIQFRVQ